MQKNKNALSNRRKFLKYSSLSSLGLLAGSQLSASTALLPEPSAAEIPEGLTILLQGDSITDAGRKRDQYYANSAGGLGVGYAYQIVSQLLGKHPGKKLRCYNRGISGHKVFQLANRWEDDCLQLKPDVLSILIGVNDFWHTLNRYDGTVEVYEKDFRKLLTRTKKALPNVKLIIAEPFVVAGGSAVGDPKWKSVFPGYQSSARKIAKEFDASFVEFQKLFDQALSKAPVDYWCPDGVHPSIAGAHLMAGAWLEAFYKLY